MGSWGDGIMENDDAMDFLGDLMDNLSSHVDEHVDGEEAYLGSVAPAVELMTLLAKNWLVFPPAPKDIRHWQADFSRALQKQFSDRQLSGDQYYKNVMASFAALESISKGFEHEEHDVDTAAVDMAGEFCGGEEVVHPKFGVGKILIIEGEGAAARANVIFETHGEKWLILSMSGIECKK